MIKAFLSHSSAQKEYVRELAYEIGYDSCIVDERTFESGKLIWNEIVTAIGNSGIFVFLISEEALQSEWVKNELSQVRDLIDERKLFYFRPFLIDEKISHEDARIKPWIKKDYNLDYYQSPILLARKIKETLREVKWTKYPFIMKKETLFLGRNTEMDKLQSKYYDGNIRSRRALIISGSPSGVGRKKLLLNFIIEKIASNKSQSYHPISIELTDGQSIEDFILQLNDSFLLISKDEVLKILNSNKEEKLELAIRLVSHMASKKELLFIRDNGACVLSNGRLSSWFADLIKSKKIPPQTLFFIATQCYPRPDIESIFSEIISLQIYPLNKNNTRVLFYGYKEIQPVPLHEDDVDFFLNKLSGLPNQVFRCIDLIKEKGLQIAKKDILSLIETGDKSIISLIDIFKNKEDSIQIMILLSQFEFISYDLLRRIVVNFVDIDDILQEFYRYSLYEAFGSNLQYIRLNVAVSDYINRSRMPLNQKYKDRLKFITKEYISNDDYALNDLSEFLFGIQQAIKSNQKGINEKYLIPSFCIKVIIEEYKQGNDDNVIILCDRVLYDNRKYYDEIERNIKYWLCSSLCRLQDVRFFDEINYFTGYSKEFLIGFYYRKGKQYAKAEKHYQLALDEKFEEKKYYAKAIHEMVIVKMKLGKYSTALKLAEDSYSHQPTNTYHIEAYLRCLIRSNKPNKKIIQRLLDELESSYDIKKDVIVGTLKAEYLFYIEDDFSGSVSKLRELVMTSERRLRYYPYRILEEILEKRDAKSILYDLQEKYADVLTDEIEDD